MQLYNRGPVLLETYRTARMLPQYVRSQSKVKGFAFSISLLGLGLIVIYWGSK